MSLHVLDTYTQTFEVNLYELNRVLIPDVECRVVIDPYFDEDTGARFQIIKVEIPDQNSDRWVETIWLKTICQQAIEAQHGEAIKAHIEKLAWDAGARLSPAYTPPGQEAYL